VGTSVARLQAVVPVAEPVADAVRQGARAWPTPPILVTDTADKYDAFAASAAALVKSGTSTLEVAMAGVPMLVAYRVNPLTAAIVRRSVSVQHASLLNLLAGRQIVPEYLQASCTPDRLAPALTSLLTDPAAAAAQRTACHAALDQLRPLQGLPSEAAADAVLNLIGAPRHGD